MTDQTDIISPLPPPTPSHGRDRDTIRVRVTRACDRCKRRKIRCNGAQPCTRCISSNSSCTFDASYTRGRAPLANRQAEFSASGIRNSPLTSARAENTLLAPIVEDPHGHLPIASTNEASNNTALRTLEPESRASPEPTQTDLQGHYVGPASGVSFLLKVQRRLHQTFSFSYSSSTIFTFGDVPLPEFDTSFCFMLSKEEAFRHLQRYFEFTVPVDRFLHRPTVESWLEEFHDTSGIMNSQEDAPARKALLFMIFALSQDLTKPKPGAVSSDMSVRYFLAAEHQLSKERGVVRLTSVQARLCQCLWLLSQSRINHCWSLFGTTAHLAMAIGLNRNRHADLSIGGNYIEIECRRRTFWCAYCLGNYLSTALGRPRTFHDDDIDQEMPSCVDDGNIYADHIVSGIDPRQSVMFAPVAYVKLSRIVSMVLHDLYSIRPSASSVRRSNAAKHTQSLKNWRVEISHFLDLEKVNTSLLVPIFQRQRNVLNLAYWHTIILTNRPFLLSSFARFGYRGENGRPASLESQTQTSIRECLHAAMSIVDTLNDMVDAGQMFQAYWFTTYFSFSAVVILYVFTIQQRRSQGDAYQPYLNAAIRCQTQISNIAQTGSLAARYCLVLEELRREALMQTRRSRDPQSSGQNVDITNQSAAQDGILSGPLGGESFPSYISPSGSLTDPVNWVHLDSLVTPDFGGLETLFDLENVQS